MRNFIVTEEIYKLLAAQVLNKIDGGQMVRLCVADDDWDFSLTAAVYYNEFIPATYLHPSEGGEVADVCPIWWEFNSYDDDAEKIDNDFSFDVLRKHMGL